MLISEENALSQEQSQRQLRLLSLQSPLAWTLTRLPASYLQPSCPGSRVSVEASLHSWFPKAPAQRIWRPLTPNGGALPIPFKLARSFLLGVIFGGRAYNKHPLTKLYKCHFVSSQINYCFIITIDLQYFDARVDISFISRNSLLFSLNKNQATWKRKCNVLANLKWHFFVQFWQPPPLALPTSLSYLFFF